MERWSWYNCQLAWPLLRLPSKARIHGHRGSMAMATQDNGILCFSSKLELESKLRGSARFKDLSRSIRAKM
jgi:hypothetical protein